MSQALLERRWGETKDALLEAWMVQKELQWVLFLKTLANT